MTASDTTLVWHWKVYNIFISFLEYFTRNYYFSLSHILYLARSFGHGHLVKIENGLCQTCHYNINILFIYSEQWPHSRNRKWPNDLDILTNLVYRHCWTRRWWRTFRRKDEASHLRTQHPFHREPPFGSWNQETISRVATIKSAANQTICDIFLK